MITKMLQPSECSAYTLQEAEDIGKEKLLLKAPFGKVFILGEDKLLLGYYSAQHYEKSGSLDMQYNITCIQNDGGIRDQVINIPLHKKGKDYEIMPIINSNGVFNGAIICTDNAWDEDKIANLFALEYLSEKDLSLEYWFLSKKYKKVAFWGLDELSLAFSDMLKHYSGIDLLGIYENVDLKPYRNIDYFNYDTDVNFVETIKDAAEAGADLIIVTDWTMRHLENSSLLEGLCADVIYAPNILAGKDADRKINNQIIQINKSIINCEAGRYVNSELYDRLKLKYRALGCNLLTVRVPEEDDLDIPHTDHTEEHAAEWLAEHNGLEFNSCEFYDFYNAFFTFRKNVMKRNGNLITCDFESTYINFINKSRVVLNAPSTYKNTIYLIGPCFVFGSYSIDKHTIGYYLQENINRQGAEYRVVPIGVPTNASKYYYAKTLEEYDIKEGDKIFLMERTVAQCKWDLDLVPTFKELYKKYGHEFYMDLPAHCGKEANKAIADFLTEHINDRFVSDNASDTQLLFRRAGMAKPQSLSGNPQLNKYKEFIRSNAIHKMPKIGSIVMNCNPFTLGHLHLIEYAAEQVDYLYIFVVEEDKSFFKFEDRIELVKAGTNHLENVKVLPSGQFIISAITFSEYFDKANLEGTTVDTSLDVETFGSQIAPCLNINVRFVGEEPLDPITAQYNQSMKEILPKYGVELCEIPRKEINGEVISASRVRKCLVEKNWDEIRKLVPETTYSFLEEKFG